MALTFKNGFWVKDVPAKRPSVVTAIARTCPNDGTPLTFVTGNTAKVDELHRFFFSCNVCEHCEVV